MGGKESLLNDIKKQSEKKYGAAVTADAVMVPEGGQTAAENCGTPPAAEELRAALEVLRSWQSERAWLNERILENRRIWRMTRRPDRADETDPGIATGWLFNSVANKHADAMDSLPEPCVLPRDEDDRAEAERLSQILPVILDGCDYEGIYSDHWWSKLIDGIAVTGVFWEPGAADGRGDISLCGIDLLNIYWEPGVRDIQDSRYVFTLDRQHNSKLIERWPQLEGRLSGSGGSVSVPGAAPDSEYSCVVDWYYRKNGKLHLCRFVGEELLFCSEQSCPGGWYRHGKYPFTVDMMYPDAGGLCGFGAVDVAKNAQQAIDRLDLVIMKNALANSRPRYFVRVDGGVSEEEFSDMTNELVHVASSSLGEDSIRQIAPIPLSDIYTDVLKLKIDELKEISGNRDFTQGYTKGGVTSGVAIAALQEAGNKLSRDLVKGSYRALSEICYLIIELIREFYTSPRSFRVRRGGDELCIRYDNRALCPPPSGRIYGLCEPVREPHFDIRVEQCKASPFSREVANERAMELWNSGFFKPENRAEALAALNIMDFDGKERLISMLMSADGGMSAAEGENSGNGISAAERGRRREGTLKKASDRIDSARRKAGVTG